MALELTCYMDADIMKSDTMVMDTTFLEIMTSSDMDWVIMEAMASDIMASDIMDTALDTVDIIYWTPMDTEAIMDMDTVTMVTACILTMG